MASSVEKVPTKSVNKCCKLAPAPVQTDTNVLYIIGATMAQAGATRLVMRERINQRDYRVHRPFASKGRGAVQRTSAEIHPRPDRCEKSEQVRC